MYGIEQGILPTLCHKLWGRESKKEQMRVHVELSQPAAHPNKHNSVNPLYPTENKSYMKGYTWTQTGSVTWTGVTSTAGLWLGWGIWRGRARRRTPLEPECPVLS